MVLSNDIYTKHASTYSSKSNASIHNSLLERPIVSNMIDDHITKTDVDASSLRVLDLGCGDGFITYKLSSIVKSVVCVDSSREMIELCKKRTKNQNNIDYKVMKIEDIDYEDIGYFDIIVSSLTLHYVEDWDSLFGKISMMLNDLGVFIFSASHPISDIESSRSKDYFSIELIKEYWPSYDEYVNTYRRPLESIFSSVKKSSMVVDSLFEANPGFDIKEKDPDIYCELKYKPNFIFIKCEKKCRR